MSLVTFEPVNPTQVTIRPRIYKVDIGKVGFQGPQGPPGNDGDYTEAILISQTGLVPMHDLDPVANNTTILNAAAADLNPGESLLIPIGSWRGDVTLTVDGTKVQGAALPWYDSVAGELVDGSIIRGKITLNDKKGAGVKRLGIDQSATLDGDGIVSGGTGLMSDVEVHQTFEELVLLGRGGADASPSNHGISAENGSNHFLRQIKVYKYNHGLAVRCMNNELTDIYAEDCDLNALIMKSALASGDAGFINVKGIVSRNHGATTGAVHVFSDDSSYETANINISGVVVIDSDSWAMAVTRAVGAGECRAVNVSDFHAVWSTPTNDGIGFAAVGACRDINLINFQAFNGGIHFYNYGDASDLRVVNGRSIDPVQLDRFGAFEVFDVNSSDVSAWAAPTFTNNWTNLDITAFQAARYRKQGDRVDFQFDALFNTVGSSTASVATLPVGFRPPETIRLSDTIGGVGLDINPDGTVVPSASAQYAGAMGSFWTST